MGQTGDEETEDDQVRETIEFLMQSTSLGSGEQEADRVELTEALRGMDLYLGEVEETRERLRKFPLQYRLLPRMEEFSFLLTGVAGALKDGFGISDQELLRMMDEQSIQGEPIEELRSALNQPSTLSDHDLEKIITSAKVHAGVILGDSLQGCIDNSDIYAIGDKDKIDQIGLKEELARYGNGVYFMRISFEGYTVLTVNKVFENEVEILREYARLQHYAHAFPDSDYHSMVSEFNCSEDGGKNNELKPKSYVLTTIIGLEEQDNLLDMLQKLNPNTSRDDDETRILYISGMIERLAKTHAISMGYLAAPKLDAIGYTEKIANRFITSLRAQKLLNGTDEDIQIEKDILIGHLVMAKAFEKQPHTTLNDAYMANFRVLRNIVGNLTVIDKFDEAKLRIGPNIFDLSTAFALGPHVSDEPNLNLQEGLYRICNLGIIRDGDLKYADITALKMLGYDSPEELNLDSKVSEKELFHRYYFRQFNEEIDNLQSQANSMFASREVTANTLKNYFSVHDPDGDFTKDLGEIIKEKDFSLPVRLGLITAQSIEHLLSDEVVKVHNDFRELAYLARISANEEEKPELLDILELEILYLKRTYEETGNKLNTLIREWKAEKASGYNISVHDKEMVKWVSRNLLYFGEQMRATNNIREAQSTDSLRKFLNDVYQPDIKKIESFDTIQNVWAAADVHRALCHYSQRTDQIMDIKNLNVDIKRLYDEQRDILNSGEWIREFGLNFEIATGFNLETPCTHFLAPGRSVRRQYKSYQNSAADRFLQSHDIGFGPNPMHISTALERFAAAMDTLATRYEAYVNPAA